MRAIDRQLARKLAGDGPVIVGPWLSEIGFEVLYWLPMLNRLFAEHQVTPSRVMTLTRGGADCWYSHLADHHLEVLDLITPDELRRYQEARVREGGLQKQLELSEFEHELLRLTRARAGWDDAAVIDPSDMYSRFLPFWGGRRSAKHALARVTFRPLPEPPTAPRPLDLPEDYVAVKAYFSRCFQPTERNQRFVAGLVRRLAARTNVVLLSTGLSIDEHTDVVVHAEDNLIDARAWMTPQDNLAVQTQIVRGARALITSYGGFSYLGPFLGVPSIALWSDYTFNAAHLEMMRRAELALDGPRFIHLHVDDVALLDDALGRPVGEAAAS